MANLTTEALQALMCRPNERKIVTQKLIELGVKREDLLHAQLEKERQLNIELKRETKEQAKKEKELEARMYMLNVMIARRNEEIAELKKSQRDDLTRIQDLTEKLTKSSLEMGADPSTLQGINNVDPVTRLEIGLNRFCQTFNEQTPPGTTIKDTMSKMMKAFQVVESLERKTKRSEPVMTRSLRARAMISVPVRYHTPQPKPPALKALKAPKAKKPRKKRRRPSPPKLELAVQDVKQEPGICAHRRNSSAEYRGQHVCTCLRVFNSDCRLRHHIRYFGGRGVFLHCPYNNPDMPCEDNFTSAMQLNEHIRIAHDRHDRFRLCGHCREVIQMGQGRFKRHCLDDHNVLLTGEDDDEERAPVPGTEMEETTHDNGEGENSGQV